MKNWQIVLIAVVVVVAGIGGYHYYDVRKDLQNALKSELNAVMLYTRISEGQGALEGRILGIDYDEILNDEKDHVLRLEKYVDVGNVVILENPYPPTREGARESEIDAIKQYQELQKKILFNRPLKEDLAHIFQDELEHYEILSS